ncbi:hypothetical protein ACFQZE_06955 [Paenibacillus sp. GCM10027627]|uniref:hypothetical protein n=1 Tax=unclassified Paenibacillus TaxID=185978 RepID=UPI00362CFDF0
MGQDDVIEPKSELIFEGGKGSKPPKIGKSKWIQEVNIPPIVSDELFYQVKEKVENKNKLKKSNE